jgi:hypothetical protein
MVQTKCFYKDSYSDGPTNLFYEYDGHLILIHETLIWTECSLTLKIYKGSWTKRVRYKDLESEKMGRTSKIGSHAIQMHHILKHQ